MKRPSEAKLLERISGLEKRIKELELLINAGPDFFFLKDLQLRYRLINAANANFFECDETDILGRTDTELMPEESALACEESDRQAIYEKRMVVSIEPVGDTFYETRKFPVIDKGEIVGVAGIIRDITDHKQTELALRTSQLQLFEAMDLANIVYWEFDPSDNTFVFNEPFYALYGTTAEQEGGCRMTREEYAERFIHPDDQQLFYQFVKRNTTSPYPESVADIEHRIVRRDGEVRHILVRARIIKDESGHIVKRYGANQDITERKRTEEEKALLEEQLRQSQKLEAIGTLAGGIAHDFNNMLAIIMGNAELALDDVQQPERRRNLEAILGASKRSRDLVRQILTFSRKTGGDAKAVDISSLLEETHKMLRSSLPSTIKIQLDLRATPGTTVMGEASKIQQVVINLANNAAHAMREKGGRLVMGLSTVILGTDSPSDARMSGPHVKLTVKDTGTGIPPEVRARMFEPFFTTKKGGQGTGMGLAVVYGIVEDLNGIIEVESEVGKGTTFTVLLPQAPAGAKDKREHQTSDVLGREHILLVDDEAGFAAMTASILERLGYRVTWTTDSLDAMRMFSQSPQSFDLIITDQTMPELTGIDLARRALSIRKDVPILLCTGYSEMVSPETAQAAGIKEFLLKPIRKKQMAQAIRRALDNEKT